MCVICLGHKQSAINKAEGLRQSTILASEAVRIEQVNQAKGEAVAILAKAQARAQALDTLGAAIGRSVSKYVCTFCVNLFIYTIHSSICVIMQY